ncbi:MAG: gamma carbonic anhydrase family protein [Spirochaetales bacterium]|nr:gamma carbonic anhydrase family protein [Spirochaetales bacterium]
MSTKQGAYVHKMASVMGSVTLGTNTSIWPGSVLRGDLNTITIGQGVNIQDNCTLHVDPDHPLMIGDYALIGHGAILHGCSIGRGALVGIGCIVLDGATIGDFAVVTARCLIRGNTGIPAYALVYEKEGKIIIKENRAPYLLTLAGSLEYIALAEHLKARKKKPLTIDKDALAKKARDLYKTLTSSN